MVNILGFLEFLVDLLALGHDRIEDADVSVHGVAQCVDCVSEHVHIIRGDGRDLDE